MRYRKMDMHVHSCYSVEPLPNLSGITFSPKETPEELYRRAKERGMDFVTITDHDTIEGCLAFLARNPGVRDFVVGEEVSTELPVSKLTVHLNVYGHTLRQHEELQKRRGNAFDVAAYCREQGLYFAWNHPFYRENLPTIEESEFMRFVDQVPVLEVRNGGRMKVLNVLAEEVAVARGKAMQGGSDTHTGNIGEVYTAVPCATVEGFFAGILQRDSRVVGRHSTNRAGDPRATRGWDGPGGPGLPHLPRRRSRGAPRPAAGRVRWGGNAAARPGTGRERCRWDRDGRDARPGRFAGCPAPRSPGVPGAVGSR